MRASRALERFLDEAPSDRVSVGWILSRLESRSFGLVMLMLALAGLAPGIASVSGILLAIPSVQMIAGRETLALPESLSKRSASIVRLARWVRRAISIFAAVERIVPRNKHGEVLHATRLIGIVDLFLAVAIAIPVPFAYIPPTLAVMAISFAQIEESAVLLILSFVIAAVAIFLVALASLGAVGFVHHLVGL